MTWNGATLFRSVDAGGTYSAFTSTTSAAIIGVASGVLGDFGGGNIFDETNTITVTLQSGGTLTSYTELQVLNGAGLCVLGAPGRWEILQYKVATLVGPSTYRLSGLLRGRRGTEWTMALHTSGDRFTVADPNAWRRPNPGNSEIGLSRMYKGVTARASLTSATGQAFTNTAAGLKPYPVVLIGGGRDTSSNLTINWTRRTRVDGEWRSNVDVPLGESSEVYDVEIRNADRTAVLRTFAGLTSPTVQYTAAQQASDGLTPGAPVNVSIYQLSQVVGRGFEARATV
jgi:hypothetical protein